MKHHSLSRAEKGRGWPFWQVVIRLTKACFVFNKARSLKDCQQPSVHYGSQKCQNKQHTGDLGRQADLGRYSQSLARSLTKHFSDMEYVNLLFFSICLHSDQKKRTSETMKCDPGSQSYRLMCLKLIRRQTLDSVCTTLQPYRGWNYFIFHRDNREVKSRNMSFTLQSNPTGMCTCMCWVITAPCWMTLRCAEAKVESGSVSFAG